MTGDLLMSFWSKSPTDVLCWYTGKFWSYSDDSIARHLSKGWSGESARKLDCGGGDGPWMVGMGVSRKGRWVGRDLEHDLEYVRKKREIGWVI